MTNGFAAIAASGLFDRAWYLVTYPDVEADGIDPLVHFMLQGWREGRDPGPEFSTSHYQATNPDVVTQDLNPLLHYLTWGWREGRVPRPDGTHPQVTEGERTPITARLALEQDHSR